MRVGLKDGWIASLGSFLRIYSDLESLSCPSPNSEFCPAVSEERFPMEDFTTWSHLKLKPFSMAQPELDTTAFQNTVILLECHAG